MNVAWPISKVALAAGLSLGVSAFAALGAVIAMYFGIATAWPLALPLLAITAALLCAVLLFAVSARDSGILTLILAGVYANNGPFWALSSEWLGGTAAAAGIAQINALGNLSNFIFNYLIGWVHAETGSFSLALMPIAAVALVGTLSVLAIGLRQSSTTT